MAQRMDACRTVERHRQTGTEAAFLLHREMGVEQHALGARQPVLGAIGMTPARLRVSQTLIRNERGYGPPQEIGRWDKIGVEDRDIRRVGMAEAEGKIAGLEAAAVVAPKDRQVHAFRHDARDIADELSRIADAAVVQHLDFELVARPVETRGRSGHADREWSLVTNRELHKDPWQRLVRQLRQAHARRRAVEPVVAENEELDRKRRDHAENSCEDALEKYGQAGHAKRSDPTQIPKVTPRVTRGCNLPANL